MKRSPATCDPEPPVTSRDGANCAEKRPAPCYAPYPSAHVVLPHYRSNDQNLWMWAKRGQNSRAVDTDRDPWPGKTLTLTTPAHQADT